MESLVVRRAQGGFKSRRVFQRLRQNTLFGAGSTPVEIGHFMTGHDCVRIRQTEYIADIVSSSTGSTFHSDTFRINPGDVSTFPWLSQIAANFEEYTLLGLAFQFKSTSSVFNATNQSLGFVTMAPEYNSAVAITTGTAAQGTYVFQTDAQLEQAEGAVQGVTSQDSLTCPIDCAFGDTPLHTKYVLTGSQPTSTDIRMYDHALFQVSTGGVSGTSQNLGKLWVHYDILLYKKQLIGGQIGNTVFATHYYNKTTGPTTSDYFGTSSGLTQAPGSNLTLTFTATTIAFPNNIVTGSYSLLYVAVGASTPSLAPPTVAYTTNCAVLNVIESLNSNVVNTAGSPTTTNVFSLCFFTVSGPNAKITFSGGTLPGTPSGMDVWIQQIPQAITA